MCDADADGTSCYLKEEVISCKTMCLDCTCSYPLTCEREKLIREQGVRLDERLSSIIVGWSRSRWLASLVARLAFLRLIYSHLCMFHPPTDFAAAMPAPRYPPHCPGCVLKDPISCRCPAQLCVITDQSGTAPVAGRKGYLTIYQIHRRTTQPSQQLTYPPIQPTIQPVNSK